MTYYYALGTTAKNNIVDWTSNGTSTSATLTGLSLLNNVNYFISVFAINSEGGTSDTISTDGIMVDTQAPVISSVSESPGVFVNQSAFLDNLSGYPAINDATIADNFSKAPLTMEWWMKNSKWDKDGTFWLFSIKNIQVSG